MIPTHGRFLVLAFAALVLVCGLTSPASAQTPCIRDGDWLVCDNGERYVIARDPDTRSQPGAWRGSPGHLGDGGRDAWMTDGGRFYSSDGRICWPHGDHVHCR